MNWHDGKTYMEIIPPKGFNYDECLVFLGRSDQEVLYQIREQMIYKLVKLDQKLVLFRIKFQNKALYVDFPLETPNQELRIQVVKYIWEWFDFDFNIDEFKIVAKRDKLLGSLSTQYDGLRIICIPDLFEAISWAIIGQQINLPFAYTLKKRFVEQFGESLTYKGEVFWCFPNFDKIAAIHIEELTELQFSKRKAEYVIGVAKTLANEELSKSKLLELNDYTQMKETLIRIRGIGAWTADYVLMKCFHQPDAFPISDVGLHQALKQQLGLTRKPTIQEIEGIAENWSGYKAYATFYLWRSLYGTT